MPIPDNSRRKTRVYRREQEAQQPYDERIGFTQPLAPRRRALDGISVAQVIAGAAAAATSMLLASRIGIAGSVIGAAVSSAVTIICSQLYRHALETSAEKLKLKQLGIGDDGHVAASDAYRSAAAPAGRRGARIAPAALQIRAAEERQATQRKVLIASIALAVGAVALTAGAILLGTAGQGLGTRPEPLFPAISTPQSATIPKDGNTQENEPETDTGQNEPAGGAGDASEDAGDNDGQTPSSSDGGAGAGPADGEAPGGETSNDGGAAGGSSGAADSSGSTDQTPNAPETDSSNR